MRKSGIRPFISMDSIHKHAVDPQSPVAISLPTLLENAGPTEAALLNEDPQRDRSEALPKKSEEVQMASPVNESDMTISDAQASPKKQTVPSFLDASLSTEKIATVLYDYHGSTNEEVTISEGERVKVVKPGIFGS